MWKTLCKITCFMTLLPPLASTSAAGPDDVVLVIHGGTGRLSDRVPEREKAMRAVMKAALLAGHEALNRNSATALDGVAAAIIVLEDSPLFNAGRGAVFTADERNELDASIMDGRDRRGGAVAGVTIVKNPILGARAVMEQTPHVLLMGHGAEQFCRSANLEIVEPGYFRTEHRLKELHEAQAEEKHGKTSLRPDPARAREWSTVGAAALGNDGHLAAGTSTGGMTNKRHGRVGDSPIIGAGTYADDRTCAVSCTGHGEFFIRLAIAHTVSDLVRYRGDDVQQAADGAIRELTEAGGTGGLIVLSPQGKVAFAYNSPGLWRGTITRDGRISVALGDD